MLTPAQICPPQRTCLSFSQADVMPSSTGQAEFSADLAPPATALVIVAHPDDAEFQCAATLAKWAAAGTLVHYVVCTDGSKGTWDPTRNQTELVATRQAEQAAAAAALGATGEIVFLGHTDGELASGLAERSQVAYEIRRLRPTVVLGHDPWKRYRIHPDHRHAGLLATEAVFAARDPFFFPEHELAPHRPDALLLFEADEPNHAESASAQAADKKVAALLEHKSQFVSTHGITDAQDPAQIERFSSRIKDALASAGEAGAGEAVVGEAAAGEAAAGEPTELPAAELFRLVAEI